MIAGESGNQLPQDVTKDRANDHSPGNPGESF
jgi:hypothetical protein